MLQRYYIVALKRLNFHYGFVLNHRLSLHGDHRGACMAGIYIEK
jgi:hypothetical protein